MTYKKEDLPKVIILVVLIVATFWVSFHYILGANAPRASRPASRGSASAQAIGAPGLTAELFAPREHSSSELLARAHRAPDPFKPYVTAEVARPAPNPPRAASSRRRAEPVIPPETADNPGLRLAGIVQGNTPMAVLIGEDRRMYVRTGETLPSGWRVLRVGTRTAELGKGRIRVTLDLSRE